MKRLSGTVIASMMWLGCMAQTYIEPLSRGVVAVPMERGNLVTWRFLSTDAKDTSFSLFRDGKKIADNLTGATCFADSLGKPGAKYIVKSATEQVSASAWPQPYLSIPLQKPADGVSPDGLPFTYSPNDCSAGDVDGDGDYEIILKWDPSNAHDNAHNGYTGDVIFDCYTLKNAYREGVVSAADSAAATNHLWRINLGQNIRAGAHYTQFLVYDFDGDGKAELICKTAPGSKDGQGRYVTEAATDETILKADNSVSYVNENGRILSGPEYLTVFSGEDGHAIHTVYYNPNRAFGVGGSADYATEAWGDHNPGNRGERFLACVAFLGGPEKNPSAVMCRGYYTQSYLWAVDFDGKQLSTHWLHASVNKHEWSTVDGKGDIIAKAEGLKSTAFGQGAHSIAVGDVDGDGCDEITYGSAAIDHDGTLLYSTGLGHGDAQHLGDLDPDRPGLEFFMVHEAPPYGCDLRDARTGEILFHNTDNEDTGRGLAADIDANHRGYEYWCSAEKKVYNVSGKTIRATENWTPQNFRIYWDGDVQDELIGNGSQRVQPGSPMRFHQKRRVSSYYIAKWSGKGCDHLLLNGKDLSDYGHSSSCNGTKATPCLQADLFGDWREELVLYDGSDRAHLNIFTTNIPTEYRVPTLMHDHVYRMGVAWQNAAYNQPPHLGYYLPDYVNKK